MHGRRINQGELIACGRTAKGERSNTTLAHRATTATGLDELMASDDRLLLATVYLNLINGLLANYRRDRLTAFGNEDITTMILSLSYIFVVGTQQ